MPRGAEAKLRRRTNRKNEQGNTSDAAADRFFTTTGDDSHPAGEDGSRGGGAFTEHFPLPPAMSGQGSAVDDSDDEEEEDDDAQDKPQSVVMPKKNKKSSSSTSHSRGAAPIKKERGIKTMPLIFLILMTGTTLLPLFIYAGDYLSAYLAKNNLMGAIGFRLGIGQVPRKRVMSFYEKHAPDKLADVPQILSKHYGDYPQLIRKLERKYQDYGYFLGWEQDETPTRLVQDYFNDAYKIWIRQWNRYAPQILKTGARNARYNLTAVYRTVRRVWKKYIWPVLEPILGVPDGGDKQKRQDAADARKRKGSSTKSSTGSTRRKNRDYRDDADDSN